MTMRVVGPRQGIQRTPCQPSGSSGSVHANSFLPSSGERLMQPPLLGLPQSSCQYAECKACGPEKFWVQGTAVCTRLPGASMVAVANLPEIGKTPSGVRASAIGSSSGLAAPPRPGEINVVKTGVVFS